MSTTPCQSIEIRRVIPAGPAQVFEAWTNPTLLARWFAPDPLQAAVDHLEAKEGGRFQITMRDPAGGETHVVGGTFLEVLTPKRIRMTWRWEGDAAPASLVIVDFHPAPAGTEVIVRHHQLSEDAVAEHREGWNACLDKLERGVLTT